MLALAHPAHGWNVSLDAAPFVIGAIFIALVIAAVLRARSDRTK